MTLRVWEKHIRSFFFSCARYMEKITVSRQQENINILFLWTDNPTHDQLDGKILLLRVKMSLYANCWINIVLRAASSRSRHYQERMKHKLYPLLTLLCPLGWLVSSLYISICYIAGSIRGQNEVNAMFWLATWAGNVGQLARSVLSASIPHKKIIAWSGLTKLATFGQCRRSGESQKAAEDSQYKENIKDSHGFTVL